MLIRFIFLLSLLLHTLSVSAQTVAVTHQPYRCVFEVGVLEDMMVASRPNWSSISVGKFTNRQRLI